ncbi:glycoside hydrolase family 3 protein [Gordonia alkaliphila]|uniref:glycoside hydrolase family 3 N-terminal domain-containing protein n=1 Tax=Gordonia alkaliphila TaxID=1053547 RepID=UPI001FF3FA96|nr:glycoside hydrolase family 3 N-terminal domain-containing protein [Gordonia alkaliphila]MCK0438818.1 glycoside hydrolase family 3 protein [Gordonia alkaliphila]
MRKVFRPIALVTGLALLAGCGSTDGTAEIAASSAGSSAASTAVSSSSAAAPAPARCGSAELAELTLRQKLAQRLVVGVTGAADAKAVVDAEQIGGIFVGSWTDMSILTDGAAAKLSKAQDVPLMVTVDQEGGRVSRLKSVGVDLPSARSVRASGATPAQVRAQSKAAGQKMAKLGITVDFAPVLDVSDEDDDDVIGDRSYSNDPAVVTEYAGAFAQGLADAGIMPVYKHFPGHGSGSGDSHVGAVRTPPLAQMQNTDLAPYRTLLRDPGTAGVMVGHLIVPGLTASDTPASISPRAIGMLRTGKGYDGPAFDGVIFSDDLSGMKAITDKYSIDQAVLRAFQAGSDIGLWLTTAQVPKVLNTLEQAVADGKLNRSRIDDSVVRILRAKGVLRC